MLNDNPNLSKDWLTWIEVGILYMKPELLTATNHDSMLSSGFDYGLYLLNTLEARIQMW